MSNRVKLSRPDECLLFQALLWISNGIQPIDNLVFSNVAKLASLKSSDSDKMDLLIALRSGQLESHGVYWGDPAQAPFQDEDDDVPILRDLWQAELVDWEDSSLRVPKHVFSGGGYYLVSMPTDKLMSLFPARVASSLAETQADTLQIQPPTAIRRGRPPRYDWSAF